MEKLIPVINKLQEVFNTIDREPLDLPQIVVVGSQSSGKSSVLEAIVGRDFLPRGSGIVTRRPLILQLIHLPEAVNPLDSQDCNEWGEFQHKPNEMFYEFDKIREEIEKETDRITGKNKGISDSPITLRIFSPRVVTLTLIDLPGITRVPIGDQPQDIEIQIRRMIKRYIDRPNCIILAISAANTDISNSDALQLAREVDPQGNRTLGVLTKLDIMDHGTDALDILLGKTIPLKLGYIGVVNRSQQDIISKKSIREAISSESEFFANHPLYRSISSKCGISYLIETLNKILIKHIRECLPELKAKVSKLSSEMQQELHSYGDPLYDTKGGQGAILLQIITKFCVNYRDAIDGKLTELAGNELYGGARMNYIFNEIFASCLNKLDPTEGLSIVDLRTAIQNATGPKASLFVPEASFELLVKSQISRLEEPGLQCVDLIHEELQRIIAQLETKDLLRFSNLRERMIEVSNALLRSYISSTKDMILNLIKIELSFINTNHPDFVGGDGAISAIVEKMAKSSGNISEQSITGGFPNRGSPPATTTTTTNNNNNTAMTKPSHSNLPTPVPITPVPPGSPDIGSPGFFSVFFGSKTTTAPVPRGTVSSNTPFSNAESTVPAGLQNEPSQVKPFVLPPENPRGRTTIVSTGEPREKLGLIPVTIKAMAPSNDKETFETELIKFLLVSYFDIVRKNIKDLVPKSIMHFLVNKSKQSLQNELVSALYKEDLFEPLLSESPLISQRRESCRNMLHVLRRAHDILNEVRDFQPS